MALESGTALTYTIAKQEPPAARAAPIALLLARGEMPNSLADSPSPNSLTSSWDRDAGLPSASASSCVCHTVRFIIRIIVTYSGYGLL